MVSFILFLLFLFFLFILNEARLFNKWKRENESLEKEYGMKTCSLVFNDHTLYYEREKKKRFMGFLIDNCTLLGNSQTFNSNFVDSFHTERY